MHFVTKLRLTYWNIHKIIVVVFTLREKIVFEHDKADLVRFCPQNKKTTHNYANNLIF